MSCNRFLTRLTLSNQTLSWGAFGMRKTISSFYNGMIQPVTIRHFVAPYFFGSVEGLESNGTWLLEELHPPRHKDEAIRAWDIGDNVQFRFPHKRFGVTRDGDAVEIEDGSDDNVWCRGVVDSVRHQGRKIDGRRYLIRHNRRMLQTNWIRR